MSAFGPTLALYLNLNYQRRFPEAGWGGSWVKKTSNKKKFLNISMLTSSVTIFFWSESGAIITRRTAPQHCRNLRDICVSFVRQYLSIVNRKY